MSEVTQLVHSGIWIHSQALYLHFFFFFTIWFGKCSLLHQSSSPFYQPVLTSYLKIGHKENFHLLPRQRPYDKEEYGGVWAPETVVVAKPSQESLSKGMVLDIG